MSKADDTVSQACKVAYRGLRFAIADYAKAINRGPFTASDKQENAAGRVMAYVDVLKVLTDRTEVDIIESCKRRAIKDGLI